MFNDIEEAKEYYSDRITQNMEEEFYGSPVGELIVLHSPISDWWEMEDEKLKPFIAKTQEKLKYMYQDLYQIEHGDYEDMVKEEWDEDANNLQTENPDWDKFLDSPAYYETTDFYRSADWKDFEGNYEDEMACINSNGSLLYDIKEVSEEVGDVLTKLVELKEEAMRETIESNFGWYY